MFAMLACKHQQEMIEGIPFQQEADGKWGMMATDGTIWLPSQSFAGKPSCVVNGMFTVPDEQGYLRLYRMENPLEPVVPRRFFRVGYFFEDVTWAQETPYSSPLLIDKEGRNLLSLEQIQLYSIGVVYNFTEGRALFVTNEGKYGFLDIKGNMVVPPLYDYACPYQEGLALVGLSDGSGRMGYQMIDKDGGCVFALQVGNGILDDRMEDGLLQFREYESRQLVYLDKTGLPALYLPDEIEESSSFRHGLSVFQMKTGCGVINKKGKILVPGVYEEAFVVGKDKLSLSKDGKCGLADREGNFLSALEYDSISRFYASDMAVVKKDASFYWMDRKGETGKEGWHYIAEDAEARQDTYQLFYREEFPSKEIVVQDVPSIKKKHPEKRAIDQDGWKKISEQNPFYGEMKKVVSGQLEEEDAGNRRLILNYVEHFRTSYLTKDIDFLEQLFSENALIVVGTVVNSVYQSEVNYLPKEQVVYNVKSKREYLNRLREVFKANKRIDVGFSGFKIMCHPTKEGIYGVSLRQQYQSDRYSDDGYLFLLWDFQDRMAPKIHVRTWQPSLQQDSTLLPTDKVFNIRNFNLH